MAAPTPTPTPTPEELANLREQLNVAIEAGDVEVASRVAGSLARHRANMRHAAPTRALSPERPSIMPGGAGAGSPQPPRAIGAASGRCNVLGCGKPQEKEHYCAEHYVLFRPVEDPKAKAKREKEEAKAAKEKVKKEKELAKQRAKEKKEAEKKGSRAGTAPAGGMGGRRASGSMGDLHLLEELRETWRTSQKVVFKDLPRLAKRTSVQDDKRGLIVDRGRMNHSLGSLMDSLGAAVKPLVSDVKVEGADLLAGEEKKKDEEKKGGEEKKEGGAAAAAEPEKKSEDGAAAGGGVGVGASAGAGAGAGGAVTIAVASSPPVSPVLTPPGTPVILVATPPTSPPPASTPAASPDTPASPSPAVGAGAGAGAGASAGAVAAGAGGRRGSAPAGHISVVSGAPLERKFVVSTLTPGAGAAAAAGADKKDDDGLTTWDAVSNVVLGVASRLEDAARVTLIAKGLEAGSRSALTNDSQTLVQELFENHVGLTTATFGVFRVIHQAVLFPAMHQLHTKLYSQIGRMKDVRRSDGWTVLVHIGDAVYVTHTRWEQSLHEETSPDHFEVQWELRMSFDRKMQNLCAVFLRIQELKFHPDIKADRKADIVDILRGSGYILDA